MLLFSSSHIANETKIVFAWLPVKVISMEVHPDKNVKVIKEEIVWMEHVGVRYMLQTGVYRGKEYFKCDKDMRIKNNIEKRKQTTGKNDGRVVRNTNDE